MPDPQRRRNTARLVRMALALLFVAGVMATAFVSNSTAAQAATGPLTTSCGNVCRS